MAYPDLAVADDLTPWVSSATPAAVKAACESVRNDARWHIAPQVTETLTVVTYGATALYLPSRRVTAVSAVRNITTGTPATITGWRLLGNVLEKSWWTRGTYEVDLTHGYAATPRELFEVIAARLGQRTVASNVQSVSMNLQGEYSETTSYRSDSIAATVTVDPVIDRYALPPGVA